MADKAAKKLKNLLKDCKANPDLLGCNIVAASVDATPATHPILRLLKWGDRVSDVD